MKLLITILIPLIFALVEPVKKDSETSIKTTFSTDQFHELGLTLLKIDKNADIHIDFELSETASKYCIDNLPFPAIYHIAIGFIPSDQLAAYLIKYYPDAPLAKTKYLSETASLPYKTELLLDHSTGRCQGASIYYKNKLSHKIIYRYERGLYKKCLIRTYSSSGDKSFTLNFQDYEL